MLQFVLAFVPSSSKDHALTRNAIDAAGRWFLHSGIQSPDGGVARFCELSGAGNRAVSNEITGYAASTYAFLFELTGDAQYRDAAIRTARFLTQIAWRPDLQTFPFENGAGENGLPPAYFFDCGIIVRGLLAVHRMVGDAEFLDIATRAGRSMARDFLTPSTIHPIVELPSLRPYPYESRWSREPGCFQLKSAVAWLALGGELTEFFESALDQALVSWRQFLGVDASVETMNRLHAFAYFLEALLFVAERPGIPAVIEEGLAGAAKLRDAIAPEFARSDVYAQILRVRLWAEARCGLRVDASVAEREYEAVLSFHDFRPDPRAEGGFYFGRRAGEAMPFANPVSTGFCLQAVALFENWRQGKQLPKVDALI